MKTRRKLEFSDGHILDNVANGAGNGSIISSWVIDEDDGKRYDYEGVFGFGKKWFEIKDPVTGDLVYEGNYMPEANEQEAFAFGKGAKALYKRSLAIGTAAIADAVGAIAIGQAVMSRANAAFATGNQTIASGPYAMSTGHKNHSKGDMSFTSGRENEAKEHWAAVFGVRNKGYAQATFVTGINNESTSYAGLTSGTHNKNNAQKSFVAGYSNINNGKSSIITGGDRDSEDERGNINYGDNSAILGGFSNRNGNDRDSNVHCSVIAGGNSNTISTGDNNFVSGVKNLVTGSCKSVVGYGNCTSYNDVPQLVCGKYNEQNSIALFMVGMGDDPSISGNKRRNALEVLVNGSINSGGDITNLIGIRSSILGGNGHRLGTAKGGYLAEKPDEVLADDVSVNYSSIVGGVSNIIESGETSSIVGGTGNKILSGKNYFATGRGNTMYKDGGGDSNFVANAANHVYGSYKAVFGTNNLTSKNTTPQLVCGNLSKGNDNALFIVGSGIPRTSSSLAIRRNVFEVLTSGSIKATEKSSLEDDTFLAGSYSAIIGGTGNRIGTPESKDSEGNVTAAITDTHYNFIAAGQSNKIYKGTRNFVANAGNNVYGSYKAVFGTNNLTYENTTPQLVCGNLSAANSEALFIVGDGASPNRINAFEVLKGRNLNSGDNTKKLKGSRSAIIGGTGNQIGTDTDTATDYNFIAAGGSNIIYNGTRNFVTNAGNYVYGSNKAVFGKANKTYDDSKPQLICGVMNSEKEDALFIVGNGDEKTETTTGSRTNAFEVYKDGSVISNKKPETDNEVVRLRDLRDSTIVPVIEFIGGRLIIRMVD